jgi:hypothetical protein
MPMYVEKIISMPHGKTGEEKTASRLHLSLNSLALTQYSIHFSFFRFSSLFKTYNNTPSSVEFESSFGKVCCFVPFVSAALCLNFYNFSLN